MRNLFLLLLASGLSSIGGYHLIASIDPENNQLVQNEDTSERAKSRSEPMWVGPGWYEGHWFEQKTEFNDWKARNYPQSTKEAPKNQNSRQNKTR